MRPVVRGVVANLPVDYAHGGGEGRAPNDHRQHECKQKDFNMQQL